MIDTETRPRLKWAKIKPLIRAGDCNELRAGLNDLSGALPSLIFKSINKLWNDPAKVEIIDILLRWGTMRHKLNVFGYLLMTSKANRLSELEDFDDENDDEDDEAKTVNMIPAAKRLLRAAEDLNQLITEAQTDEGMNVLHFIVEYGPNDLLDVVVQLAREGKLSDIETLLNTPSEFKASPMRLIVELKKTDMLHLLLSSLPELMVDEATMQKAIDSEKSPLPLLFAKLRPQCATVSFLKSAISLADTEILEEVLESQSPLFIGCGMLSHAVTKGDVKVIEVLMRRCPQLAIELDSEGRPALSHLQEISDSTKRKGARSAVIPGIIRRTHAELQSSASESEGKTTIEIIRMWLAEPKDRRKEISLDLGGFRSSSRSIKPFLEMIRRSLTSRVSTQAAELKVDFESTLRYVDIPVPDFPESETGNPMEVERSEARAILDWLRNKQKVSGIYELRVRDSFFSPHSEEVISQCLAGFDVELLDWMRTDMSVKPLLATCPNLKKLVLYASNWATLSYWTSGEAIADLSRFQELKSVSIFILSDTIGPSFGVKYLREAKGRLEAIRFMGKTIGDSKSSSFSVDFHLRSWYSIRRRKEETPVLKKTTATEVTQLDSFIKAYSVLQKELRDPEFVDEINPIFEEDPCVRVAVIDTGVDPDSIRCSEIRGASFVPSDSGESPWWFSYHPHGTQMAKLISELNPHCKLLVAKVGDSIMDMTVERLIQALRWAVDSEADIISLSAAFFKADKRLSLAIHDAIAAGVIVIASTAGEAHKQEEAYPANYAEVIKIAATDLRGKETSESLASLADYMFPGDRIVAETTFLGTSNPSSEISGTSVATAIASGVASLVLACHRLSLSTQMMETPWAEHKKQKREVVKRVFNSMVDNKGKFVKPWLFFNEADQQDWGEASRTLKWLGQKEF